MYISGSFCVSKIAANGIPKLEAGPQKSVHGFAYFSWWSGGIQEVAQGSRGHTC